MRLNNNIYYYASKNRLFGCWIFIVKGTSNNYKQYMIESATANKMHGYKDHLQDMEKDGIDITNTDGIFLTHEHPDHSTGIELYRNIIGREVPVYFNNKYLKYFRDPNSLKEEMEDDVGVYRKEITKVPTGVIQTFFNVVMGSSEKIYNTIGIKEGEIYPLDENSKLEVILSPGHSKAHTSYLIHCNDGKKILLSGDSISFKENNNDLICLASINTPSSTYSGEIQTLRKYLELDIDVLVTSHYGIYEGQNNIKKFIKEALNRVLGFEKEIIELLREGPKDIKDLTNLVISKEKIPQYLGGFSTRESTIFAILMHLLDQGKIRAHKDSMVFSLK